MQKFILLFSFVLSLNAFRAHAVINANERFLPTLINGTDELAGLFPEVVLLQTGRGLCSGTLIGPRVVLSAGHCVQNGTARFMYGGRSYKAVFSASRDFRRGHDLAVAVTDRDIQGARYARIGTKVKLGEAVHLAGYGCTRTGGKGKPGELRIGSTQILQLDKDRILSGSRGGGALCFGDSGGPAFVRRGEERYLVGVNSSGNIRNLNVDIRLDSALSRDFFGRVVRKFGVDICGLNLNCPSHAPKLASR